MGLPGLCDNANCSLAENPGKKLHQLVGKITPLEVIEALRANLVRQNGTPAGVSGSYLRPSA
jgi:hypothetical protein